MVINEYKTAPCYAGSITLFFSPSVPMQLKSEVQEVTSSSSPTGDTIIKGALNDFCPGGSS